MHQVWKPLIGLVVLALLPEIVIVGETGSRVEQGVPRTYSYNYAGILFAAAGLVLALSLVFRRSVSRRLDAEPMPPWARVTAGALGLFCLLQLAASAGWL